MINKLLVYLVSICIIVIVIVFINRVIFYRSKNILQHSTTKRKKKLLPKIIDEINPEKKFFFGNHESIN